tara:strand:+ start:201 stop:473 length:273 start_codon:yes stop_codon:yes gene_type:complete
MNKKILNISFLLSFLFLIFLVTKHYFSQENIILTNKSRSSYSIMSNEENINLPLLKSDTNNIITYKDDIENFSKERKKWFWENLFNNFNE